MIQKKFNKSFDDALTQAYLFQTNFIANKADFIAFSSVFADPYGADFLDLITDADEMPTFEDDQNEQAIYTLQVEESMEKARDQFKKLSFSIDIAWPNSEINQRAFRVNLYESSRQIPQKMINLLQNAHAKAISTTFHADFVAAGFSAADITLLESLANELTQRYNAQQDFIQLTFERTEKRTIAFNKVWDEMVKISNASKMIFKNSPARIETFLLYPEGTGPGALIAPTGLSFTISNMKISWNSVTNATSYIASISTDGGITFEEVFTGVENQFVYSPSVDGTVIVKVMGNNANGHGPEATLTFSYFSVLPTVENVEISLVGGSASMFELTFSPVLSATAYKIYKSEVAIGNLAGEYTYVTDVTGTVYSGNAVSGKRSWFVVKSSNATQQSGFSEAVYLDVAAGPV